MIFVLVVLVKNTKAVVASCKSVVNVALGLIKNNNKILLMQRLSEPYKNYWELPGGKIESDETAEQAVKRELQEELGIEVLESVFIQQFYYDYPEYSVNLEVFEINKFSGQITGKLGQNLTWVDFSNYQEYLILPATLNIII